MVIEEKWFSYMNLTNSTIFPLALVKRATLIFNQSNNLSPITKQFISKIAINNVWNTQVVHILCEKHDGKFHSKGNILSRIPKPIEISH